MNTLENPDTFPYFEELYEVDGGYFNSERDLVFDFQVRYSFLWDEFNLALTTLEGAIDHSAAVTFLNLKVSVVDDGLQ